MHLVLYIHHDTHALTPPPPTGAYTPTPHRRLHPHPPQALTPPPPQVLIPPPPRIRLHPSTPQALTPPPPQVLIPPPPRIRLHPSTPQALIELLSGALFSDLRSIVIYCTRRQQTEHVTILINTCMQQLNQRYVYKYDIDLFIILW